LYGLARWLPEDLLTLAWWLSVLAAIIFGLVAPSWPLRPHPVRRRTDAARPVKRTRTHIARWFLLVALLAAVANLVYLAATGNEQFAVRLVWVGGLFLWLWGCAWLNPPPR